MSMLPKKYCAVLAFLAVSHKCGVVEVSMKAISGKVPKASRKVLSRLAADGLVESADRRGDMYHKLTEAGRVACEAAGLL